MSFRINSTLPTHLQGNKNNLTTSLHFHDGNNSVEILHMKHVMFTLFISLFYTLC